jgi:hypothetical protein
MTIISILIALLFASTVTTDVMFRANPARTGVFESIAVDAGSRYSPDSTGYI